MIRVGIVGASGYTGLELIKMLVMHSGFDLRYVATSEGDISVESLHPSLKDIISMDVVKADVDDVARHCDLVFLALPHKTSMGFAKGLLRLGVKVVDLSADYRLEIDTYEEYYCKHTDKDNSKNAVYALVEYYREELKNTNLAAGPGCYPTATLLGILPFTKYLDSSAPMFVDAKSGVSGAGKKLSDTTHYVNVNDNIFSYNPLSHRHSPEIAEKIEIIEGVQVNVNFVPHLIPATRGELVSIYGTLTEDIDPIAILKERYKDDPFIRIRENPVDIKSCLGTHFCDIYAKRSGNALFVSSAIDNLLRGASSQALVAANLMSGYSEGMGIPTMAYVP